MKCRICGSNLNQGETFCKNCGASNTNEAVPDIKVNKDILTQDNISHDVTIDKKTSDNGRFFLIIGILITIIALIVVIYLVYNTLKARDSKKTSANIAVITTNNYYVNYKNRTFSLTPEISTKVYGDYLELSTKNYRVKILYENTDSYAQINIDLIKNAYFETSDFALQEPSLKIKDNLSYYYVDIDHYDGKKTTLVIVPDKTFGYWLLEIGTKDLKEYPTSEMIDEIFEVVLESINTEEENKLNLDFSKITKSVNETQNDETSNN